VLSALAVTILFQYYFQHFAMNGREELSPFIHWSVFVVAMLLLCLSIIINYRMVSRLLHKL
jgi:amino acid transporter